jgi:hypothetical protein
VWNHWLSSPFTELGLPHHCCTLLQGMAEGKQLADVRGRKWMLALVSRRSCLHPGTRYLARGLNSAASPGNEVECEQLVWTQDNHGASTTDGGGNGGAGGPPKIHHSLAANRRVRWETRGVVLSSPMG